MNILISTTSFATFSNKPLEIINKRNYNVIINKYGRKVSSDEIIELAKDAVGIIAGTESYTNEVFQQLPHLKVISRLGVGMDNIDLETAKGMGIKVYKTQTTPAQAVAELVVGLMVDAGRKISIQCSELKNGTWNKQMGELLHGKTLGIIGLGTIGKTLVKLVKGFNFNILAFDIFHDKEFARANDISYCSLENLLRNADIVSTHLNLSENNIGIMGENQFAIMKPTSIFINTSRGEVVDEKALFYALECNKIGAAGIDVFHKEPYKGKLRDLENVVLTPHIGSYAKEIRIQMEIEATKNLINGLENE
jgi:D-3-phosphoglycerate dehydrogenase